MRQITIHTCDKLVRFVGLRLELHPTVLLEHIAQVHNAVKHRSLVRLYPVLYLFLHLFVLLSQLVLQLIDGAVFH